MTEEVRLDPTDNALLTMTAEQLAQYSLASLREDLNLTEDALRGGVNPFMPDRKALLETYASKLQRTIRMKALKMNTLTQSL